MNILFVPGTFGTTVQYILRAFSTTYISIKLPMDYRDLVIEDGSMHSFAKIGHYLCQSELEDIVSGKSEKPILTSPIYPMQDFHANEVINFFKDNFSLDKYIFIYINSIKYAEINMLAQYYKNETGQLPVQKFCGDNIHNIIKWNSNYTHWNEMQQWELREWISIFYPIWVQEWMEAKQYADPNWMCISTQEILDNPYEVFSKLLHYSGPVDLESIPIFNEFVRYWSARQQFLEDEYKLINCIVNTTILNEPFTWSELNIVAEAIIQQHLRKNGFEIKCYNLNKFPQNSIDLHNLLEPI